MAYCWSISTTIRNPDRIKQLLLVINSSFYEQKWDTNNQIKFQVLLIQYKFYKPTKIDNNEKEKFDNFDQKLSYQEAKKIFDNQGYEDPPMRGRTSMSPLKKLGLVALDKENRIGRTQSGQDFFFNRANFSEILFNFFIKWQYPNPSEKENKDFNVKPFFVADLSIDKKLSYKEKKIKKRAKQISILQKLTKEVNAIKLDKLLNNLKDYTDNTIRYFRATKYLYIRGNGYYIDLEPRRDIEIQFLLSTYSGGSESFASERQYINHLGLLPQLPYEDIDTLTSIIDNLVIEIKNIAQSLNQSRDENLNRILRKYDQYKKYHVYPRLNLIVKLLRSLRTTLLNQKKRNELQNIAEIERCIESLNNIRNLNNKPSIELERWSAMALYALNDAIYIKPNYPVGDDNEPLFTAPANKPDIECSYKSFKAICEVTMLTGKNQWFNEGQPVMRHLRSFEKFNEKFNNYCLFIAPKIHQDTINTFWMATKYKYEGEKQSIVPLTINQMIDILKMLILLKQENKKLLHTDIKDLFDSIVQITQIVNSSQKWIKDIPQTIEQWKNKILWDYQK